MSRRPFGLFYAICFVVALLPLVQNAFAMQSDASRRAFTVDDMLRLEGVGKLIFGPKDSGRVIFEYLEPYEERGQYGIDRGGQILQLSPSTGQPASALFEHQPGAKYWLGDVSPDGQRLLIFQATRHLVRVGIYDFQAKNLLFSDVAPQINERFEMNRPIWANAHEVIFTAAAADSTEYAIRQRPYVADRTSRLREKAFSGGYSGATLTTSPTNPWYGGFLAKYNVRTDRTTTIGQGRFGSFALSGDGKRLAALRLGQRQLHFPVNQLTDYFRFHTQLHVFDLEKGGSDLILPDMHIAMGSLRWSVTGARLSFFAWDPKAPMADGSHYVLGSGSTTPIHVAGFATGWVSLAGYATQRLPVPAEWLQQRLAIYGVKEMLPPKKDGSRKESVNADASGGAKWHAIEIDAMSAEAILPDERQSHKVSRLHDGRLLLRADEALVIASGAKLPMRLNTPTFDSIEVLNGGWKDTISNTMVFAAEFEGNRHFGFFDVVRNELIDMFAGQSGEVLGWHTDRQRVIIRKDTEDGGVLQLLSVANEPATIFVFNQDVSTVEHPQWRAIEYTKSDGVETYSCILLPYNYDPQKAYPTIVDVYPGTGKACKSGSDIRMRPLGHSFPFHNSNEILAANGYLVVLASNNYGENYANDILFGGLHEQVDAALNGLIDSGMTDPKRIGIWGFSNGSMASLWLASASDRYKAVVPMFGASSPHIEYFSGSSSPTFQMYLGTPIVHLVQYESATGGMPHSMGRSATADPMHYIRSSPLDRAASLCSPLMMVQSDLDGFTTFHYEALFSAMYRLGRRADLVRYYGEGHGLRSPGNIRDFYRRVLEFFGTHVASGKQRSGCGYASAW